MLVDFRSSIVLLLSVSFFVSSVFALNPSSTPSNSLEASGITARLNITMKETPARLTGSALGGARESNRKRAIGNERLRYEIVKKRITSKSEIPLVQIHRRESRDEVLEKTDQVENELVKLLAVTSPKLATMPGRKLSVRPIGLIVLGSLFSFAFLVIGFGTFEKYQYRKLYRSRRLEQQQRQRDQLAIDPFRG